MAIATDCEYGLFIAGELAEPASREVRALVEPATGAPLARAAMAGEADVDRAVDAAHASLAGDWGKTPRGRAFTRAARAGGLDRREPCLARRARVAIRRQEQSGFGRELGIETLELYFETKSVIVSTGTRQINPLGL